MNSFNLTLSGKYFICPPILNDSFVGQSNLGCSLCPHDLEYSFQPLLVCKVSFEKLADSLMGTPLQVTVFFSLVAVNILSLYLILGNVMMMCLGVFLLGSNFFDSLSFLDFLKVCSLCQTGEVCFITFSNKFSVSCSSSSPSGATMIWMLEHLKLSQSFVSLSFF